MGLLTESRKFKIVLEVEVYGDESYTPARFPSAESVGRDLKSALDHTRGLDHIGEIKVTQADHT